MARKRASSMDSEETYKALYLKLHEEACKRQERSYSDPKTGFIVLTAVEHRARGYCCESGCRHCPYKNEQNEN
ncbi:MAG: hypothetical protein K1X83_08890 [Oligoflexia bacterium]|nr:hypothetical protein [Oligoflexia bacterium]